MTRLSRNWSRHAVSALRPVQALVLVASAVVMGFVRMTLMMVNMMAMMTYLTGKNMSSAFEDAPERTEDDWQKMMSVLSVGMAYLYFILLSMAQAGTSFAAWIAHMLTARSVYEAMVLVMACLGLLTLLLMPHHWFDDTQEAPEGDTRWPFNAGRVFSALLLIACAGSFAYFTTHGYNQDWLRSPNERIALASALFFGGAFLVADLGRPVAKRYFNWELLSLPSARWALLLFVIVMLLISSAMLVTVCSQVGMLLDQWQSAVLSMWGWVGYVVATLLITFTFRFVHYRHYWTMAFGLFAAYALAIYLSVQQQMDYDQLVYLTVIRATGLYLVYVSGMVLSFYHRPGSMLTAWMLCMILLRNMMAPAAGVAFMQQELLNGRLEYLQGYAPSYNNMMVLQSTIASVKHLAGIVFWASLAVVILVLACRRTWLFGKKTNTQTL